MNILIIQTAKLGDMVCITPLFRATKLTYPTAKLYVMGSALNKELLAGNPHIDEYVVIPSELSKVRPLVSEKKIDAAICTSPNPGVLWQLMRAGVKKIVVPQIKGGFSPYATKTYRLLSLFATKVPLYFGQYMPRQYLRLLEPLGIYSDDVHKELFYSKEAQVRAGELLKGVSGVLVGIAPGVGNKIKSWGGKNFAVVANKLGERRGVTLVLLGGPADTAEVEEMRAHLDRGVPCIDLAGKLSLEELKAVIARLHLYIAVDTGPIYIAEALDIPTVDIVGPMDEKEQPPRGQRHLLVVDPARRAPALHIMNAAVYDKEEARRHVERIRPAMVIAAVERLMKELMLG